MGAALACMLVTVGMDGSGACNTTHAVRESLPQRELAFELPEGGGWVALPWTLARHPEGTAQVMLETPAELNFHQHSAHMPTVQLVSCEGERCLHQFTAPTGKEAEPLRVRIADPGRYVFNVSYALKARHIEETFVVRAVR